MNSGVKVQSEMSKDQKVFHDSSSDIQFLLKFVPTLF